MRGLAELEATRPTSTEAQSASSTRPGPPLAAAHASQVEPTRPHAPQGTPPAHRRHRSPLVALVLPALLGLVAFVLLNDEGSSRRGALGFVAAVLAAPVLPVLGVPLRSGTLPITLAVAASAVLWLALGWWATRRSSTWTGFVTEYGWMVLAVWIGTGCAALAADLILGRPAF